MKLVLLGIQGSGKSTQGNMLSKQLGIPYLSTGHIFREIAKEKTQLGRYIKETMNSGLLIPDEKTIEIVENYLERPAYRRGYILDGFPRTLNQVKKFKNHVDKVIYLNIPDREALWRLAYRNDSEREDETVAAVRKRIELFHKFTKPVMEYYEKKNKLLEIDGTESIEEVNENILKGLGKQLVENKIEVWKQKNKAIIAVTGLPGAGKTEACNFYREMDLPVISFSAVINEYIDKKKLPHSQEIHAKVREEIREKYGMGALAILNEKKLKQALKKHQIVIIEGMRSWEEYTYLKEKLSNVKVYIVAIHAEKDLRYSRISHRKYRSQLFGEERDLREVLKLNMGPTIAFADFLIKNNFSVKEFHDKLEDVYREVYYS